MNKVFGSLKPYSYPKGIQMRKIVIALLIITGLTVAAESTTSAVSPTATVTSSCTGLKVSLGWYQQPRAVRVNNRVVVTIDGITYTEDFSTLYSKTFTWDPTIPHNYIVTVDANRIMGASTLYDSTNSGTQPACAV